jgi:hypothetical protein
MPLPPPNGQLNSSSHSSLSCQWIFPNSFVHYSLFKLTSGSSAIHSTFSYPKTACSKQGLYQRLQCAVVSRGTHRPTFAVTYCRHIQCKNQGDGCDSSADLYATHLQDCLVSHTGRKTVIGHSNCTHNLMFFTWYFKMFPFVATFG